MSPAFVKISSSCVFIVVQDTERVCVVRVVVTRDLLGSHVIVLPVIHHVLTLMIMMMMM